MYESNERALVVPRVAAGAVMLAHGTNHARARVRIAGWFDSIGFRIPGLQWFASTATEIGIGALLLAGFANSVAASGSVAVWWSPSGRCIVWRDSGSRRASMKGGSM
ncbi:MAG: DoxX family protein [Acidimicrobiia bacterium]